MRIIDSHCHLVDEKIIPIADEVLARAKLAGVEKFITMAGGRNEWQKLMDFAVKEPGVFIALGWHPEDIKQVEDLADLKELIQKTEKCVAIGEVGLDFFYDKEKQTKTTQMAMLRKQIELALELNKPLVIHVRSAEEEMLEVIEEFGNRFRAHFHCFGEGERLLRKVLEGDHIVSFGGNVTFKSAENLRSLLKLTPIEKLVLETDSPYLSPEPVRGTQNEPANIVHTAHFIAKELKIEVEALVETTYRNSICFFGLEK